MFARKISRQEAELESRIEARLLQRIAAVTHANVEKVGTECIDFLTHVPTDSALLLKP